MKKYRFQKGVKYNLLTTVKNLGVIKGNTRWLCKCDCGSSRSFPASNVRTGKTKSCGCIGREKSRQRMLVKRPERTYKAKTLKTVYRRYLAGAKRRNILFRLNYEDFENLVTQNCYYCGDKPNQELRRKDKDKSLICYFHGVDRIDNSKGYSFTNCVTACKTCNICKWTLDVDDFLGMVEKVYNNLVKPHKIKRK